MLKKTFDVAIVGATGAVGREMIDILASRQFPVRHCFALASNRSLGQSIAFGEQTLSVGELDHFDFSKVQLALFSAGGGVSARYAPRAVDCGCIVIDNSSYFRYDDDIPLIIPEINLSSLGDYANRGIIANPNCSTIQMLMALNPLHLVATIERIDVCTYQAVSGAGSRAIDLLANQTKSLLAGVDCAADDVFPVRIAFNAIPHVDEFQDNGYTREEMKMVWETHKILSDDSIVVNPTAVRIPVFYGHSEAVSVHFANPMSADEARVILTKSPGVVVIDDIKNNGYPTACCDSAGNDAVFVGRIRNQLANLDCLNLWVVGDNLRKGAALNAVQIAESLVAEYL